MIPVSLVFLIELTIGALRPKVPAKAIFGEILAVVQQFFVIGICQVFMDFAIFWMKNFLLSRIEQLNGNLEHIMGLYRKTMTMKHEGTLSKMQASKFDALVNTGVIRNTPALV